MALAVSGCVAVLLVAASACGDEGEAVPDTDGRDDEGGAAVDDGDAGVPATVTADDIPVAHTPPGGYGDTMPPPVLARCTEPLVEGAPDLGGLWQVVEVEAGGAIDPAHPALGHVQRIEQCGDRLVVTAGGIVHDMRCDGTEEHGVHDVAEFDKTTPITVVATYEDGVHVLRPVGLPVEVTRRLDGDQLVWTYLGFTARLDRLGPPDQRPPSSTIPTS